MVQEAGAGYPQISAPRSGRLERCQRGPSPLPPLHSPGRPAKGCTAGERTGEKVGRLLGSCRRVLGGRYGQRGSH